jgi:hypothetical protein
VLPTMTQEDFEKLETQIMYWDFQKNHIPETLKNYLQTL